MIFLTIHLLNQNKIKQLKNTMQILFLLKRISLLKKHKKLKNKSKLTIQ